MYALMESNPYEELWPIAYFETEEEAKEALQFIYNHDKKTHPNLPQEDWDWGYHVTEITPKTLPEFKILYKIEEKLLEEIYREKTLGGDDCYIGRSLYNGDTITFTGTDILANS